MSKERFNDILYLVLLLLSCLLLGFAIGIKFEQSRNCVSFQTKFEKDVRESIGLYNKQFLV